MSNISDVAKAAGVSRSTVSRVINNYEGVNEDKRDSVLKAIKKLHYVPNGTARALSLSKTNTIGVIAKELTGDFFGDIINHIHYHADFLNYGVVYCIKNNYGRSNINYIEFLNRKVDGYIFLGEMTVNRDELMYLSKMKVPVVVFTKQFDVPNISCITINNKSAVYKIVDYLVSLGHDRILNISISAASNETEFVERNKAYEEAVNKYELDYNKSLYVNSFEMADIYEITTDVYNEIVEKGVSAAFCANNVIATGVIDGLIDRGIKIPEDFSVVGFDDNKINEYTNNIIQPITSIKQPQVEMSEYGIDSIVKMADSGIGNYSKMYECELMIRKTTAKR